MFLRRHIYILGYHSVKDWSYPHSVWQSEFRFQMEYIKKHFDVLSLQDFDSVLSGKVPLKRDAVMVTFDDGVEDNLTNALPILSEFNIPAVLFLSTYYVDRLHHGPRGKEYTFKFLSWDQCRALQDSGLFAIESHTHNHPLLTEISESEIDIELRTATSLIEKEIGKKPISLSYPKGQYNQAALKIVKKHYRYGFAIDGGILTLSQFNPYIIPRVLISQEVGRRKFKLMLTPYYWFFKSCRDKLVMLFR